MSFSLESPLSGSHPTYPPRSQASHVARPILQIFGSRTASGNVIPHRPRVGPRQSRGEKILPCGRRRGADRLLVSPVSVVRCQKLEVILCAGKACRRSHIPILRGGTTKPARKRGRDLGDELLIQGTRYISCINERILSSQ